MNQSIEQPKHDKTFNFLINASNQANLARTNNMTTHQLNSLFVLVQPYNIEKFNLEGVDIELKIDEQGLVWLNNQQFELIEIQPGVSIFGLIKR